MDELWKAVPTIDQGGTSAGFALNGVKNGKARYIGWIASETDAEAIVKAINFIQLNKRNLMSKNNVEEQLGGFTPLQPITVDSEHYKSVINFVVSAKKTLELLIQAKAFNSSYTDFQLTNLVSSANAIISDLEMKEV